MRMKDGTNQTPSNIQSSPLNLLAVNEIYRTFCPPNQYQITEENNDNLYGTNPNLSKRGMN